MKRVFAILLAVTLLLSVTACTPPAENGGTTTTTTTAAGTVPTGSETAQTTLSTVGGGDPTQTTTTVENTVSTTDGGSAETTTVVNVVTTVSQTVTTVTTKPVNVTTLPTVPPTTVTTTRPTVTEPNVTRVITCWGDSITEGMSMGDTERYPYVLDTLLGNNYVVQNSGDGGEDTLTIMAREGAVPVYLQNAVTFAAGETRVLIGTRTAQGIVSADGTSLKLRPQLGRQLSINDVTIGGETYAVSLENYDSIFRTYDVYLTRKNATAAVTIPAKTPVKFASINAAKTNYCDVYLMGANGGWNDDPNTLVSQFKQMIDYRGNDNYLVVIPYWRTDCNDALKAAFGDKAIDFAAYAKNKGLAAMNITPSKADSQAMYKGLLPNCLTLNGTSVKQDVHLNQNGYRMLATAVYETGRDLGYWN